jgi:hypothetical protein
MFFIDDPEMTKHGYYITDTGIKTFSKYEAYIMAGKDWTKFKFIFNDHIYDQYDWTIEPEEDIYELYRQRAIQLREKYDYLVLMYSGGIDSTTIFNTFLDHGIKLDEACSFTTTDLDVKTNTLNQEVFNRAVPYFESVNASLTGTKFRHIEIGRSLVDQWDDEFHYENFHHYANGSQWWALTRSHKFKSLIKDHLTLSEQGKKICYIWGFDKPTILRYKTGYAVAFPDLAVDLNSKQYVNRVLLKEKFANFYDEGFYITGDFPKISIKQGHMLVKLLKTMPEDDSRLKFRWELPHTGPFVTHHQTDQIGWDGGFIYKFLDKRSVDGCIYPKENINSFGMDKVGGSLIFSKRDNWFNKSDDKNKFRFDDKIRKMVKETPYYFSYALKQENGYGFMDHFFEDEKYKNLIPKVGTGYFSKAYFILKHTTENIQHD